MNPITSIYIPRIETRFNSEFIYNVFKRNGIAQVSRIYIEPYKTIMKNEDNKNKNNYNYNNAYIEILCWYDTETANNFIECLRNPCKEARIVYGHNNWWSVHINNYPHKVDYRKQVLTIFKDNNMDHDNFSTTAVADEYTQYKKNLSKKIHRIGDYIHNEYDRELKAKIYGYKNATEMNAAEEFDGYLHEKPKTFV
jgi:hypothetical protein